MSRFTKKQGQYLAFIHLYRKLHRQGPAELDIARYFRVSPPTDHRRIGGAGRSGHPGFISRWALAPVVAIVVQIGR